MSVFLCQQNIWLAFNSSVMYLQHRKLGWWGYRKVKKHWFIHMGGCWKVLGSTHNVYYVCCRFSNLLNFDKVDLNFFYANTNFKIKFYQQMHSLKIQIKNKQYLLRYAFKNLYKLNITANHVKVSSHYV